jgi:hypothetical protein
MLSGGVVFRDVYTTFAGAMSNFGALIKQTAVGFEGSSSSIGDIGKIIFRTIDGTMLTSGSLIKQTAVSFAGTFSSTGELVKGFFVVLVGTMNSAGTMLSELNPLKLIVALTFKARTFGESFKLRSAALTFKERVFGFFVDDRDME